MSKVILIGRLGGDPEVRYTKTGKAVCDLSLAVNEQVRRGAGFDLVTTWHRVVLWQGLAEDAQSLRKGSAIRVEGFEKRRTFQGRDGKTRGLSKSSQTNSRRSTRCRNQRRPMRASAQTAECLRPGYPDLSGIQYRFCKKVAMTSMNTKIPFEKFRVLASRSPFFRFRCSQPCGCVRHRAMIPSKNSAGSFQIRSGKKSSGSKAKKFEQ
jgi:single stranded DNA-binding protein